MADNVGSFDQTVLNNGPWSTITPKKNLREVMWLPTCSGDGDTELTVQGNPSDAAVAKAVRAHEDHHAADDARVVAKTIGKWDGLLSKAKTSGKTFEGADD